MAEGSRTFRGAGEENERRKDERQDQPATRAPPHRRPVARGTLAPWSKRARQLRRDEAILFILFGASGNRAQVSRPCHNVGSARAPRDQDQGPSTRRFSQARARVANLPPGVRTPRRGDSRISRAAIADGRPTTPPRDPHGANDRRVQRRPRWGAPLRLEQRFRLVVQQLHLARQEGTQTQEGAQAQAQVQEGAQIGQEARARRRRRRPTVRARAPPNPRSFVRRAAPHERARRRNTRVFRHRALETSPLTVSSHRLVPPPLSTDVPDARRKDSARRNVSSNADGRTRTPRSFPPPSPTPPPP